MKFKSNIKVLLHKEESKENYHKKKMHKLNLMQNNIHINMHQSMGGL